MAFALRPCTLPADYAHMVAILNAVRVVPVTVDELQEQDSWMPEGSICHRLIAEDGAGRAIGFGEAHRWPNTMDGKLYVTLATLPAVRGQGIGSALLERIERFTAELGATRLVGDVEDHDANALAYLERRGYVVERHGYDSTLDLATFDIAPFAGAVGTVEAKGIRFFTLADAPGAAMERALYELYERTMVDIPGYEAKAFMSYETWRRFVVAADGARPEWTFIAADGDRLVGVTTAVVSQDHIYTNHTLVDREYRGRAIALALKVLAVQAALRHGAPYMRTGNDSLNGPMLAVNRKLGYKPLAGAYTVAKRPRG
jgi:GNAT superfamily N-acetyltransferase